MHLFEMVPEEAIEWARTIVTNPRMLFTTNCSDHHALLAPRNRQRCDRLPRGRFLLNEALSICETCH
jgi:hypothetical protein